MVQDYDVQKEGWHEDPGGVRRFGHDADRALGGSWSPGSAELFISGNSAKAD